MKKTCEQCKTEFEKKPSDSIKYWSVKRFCSIECSGTLFKKGHKPTEAMLKAARRSGEEHPSWRGGRSITVSGYVEVRVNKKRYLEHRHVMEQHLGRKLSKREHVHHINGDKQDNRIENLRVMGIREHNRQHTSERWNSNKPFRKGLKHA